MRRIQSIEWLWKILKICLNNVLTNVECSAILSIVQMLALLSIEC